MTKAERRDALVMVVVASAIAVVGASAGRALFSNVSAFSTDSATAWFFRFRAFDVTTEMLALGSLAYVLPRSRATTIAARLAAACSVVAFGADAGEWFVSQSTRFSRIDGGGIARGVLHGSELAVLLAVVAMWYVGEYRFGSDEIAAADLS